MLEVPGLLITLLQAFEGDEEKPGFIVTGSKGGQLVWWAQPSCEWFANVAKNTDRSAASKRRAG